MSDIDWRPIESAPTGQALLVFGLDRRGVNSILAVAKNTTGIAPFGNSFSRWDVVGAEEWGQEELACDPTHWRPLPSPPGRKDTP